MPEAAPCWRVSEDASVAPNTMAIANGCVDGASMKKNEPPGPTADTTPRSRLAATTPREELALAGEQTLLAADTVSH